MWMGAQGALYESQESWCLRSIFALGWLLVKHGVNLLVFKKHDGSEKAHKEQVLQSNTHLPPEPCSSNEDVAS